MFSTNNNNNNNNNACTAIQRLVHHPTVLPTTHTPIRCPMPRTAPEMPKRQKQTALNKFRPTLHIYLTHRLRTKPNSEHGSIARHLAILPASFCSSKDTEPPVEVSCCLTDTASLPYFIPEHSSCQGLSQPIQDCHATNPPRSQMKCKWHCA